LRALLAVFAFLGAPAWAQTIATAAGNGTGAFAGDGAAANLASIRFPAGAAVDSAGNLYIADSANHRIRKVDAGNATITTVAGNGTMGFGGDGAAATAASLSFPAAIAVDAAGNLYIADTGNSRIRKVTPAGTISTIAGNGTLGSAGDGAAATAASLHYPGGVAVDTNGNVYIADTYNHRVRVVAVATGVINTIAGTGTAGSAGDRGAAAAAQLYHPQGLALNATGTLYVADTYNHRVRSVGGGTIDTFAGSSSGGYGGDGGAATAAQLNLPTAVAFDAGGNLYLADFGNHRIRVVPSAGGLISTFAGAGTAGYSGDGGEALAATMNLPSGVAANGTGVLYLSDSANHRVRKVGDASLAVLNLAKAGAGSGTIISAPAGIACGSTCFRSFATGSSVTLTAAPASGSTFGGWSVSACGQATTCTVTVSAATSVTATFDVPASTARLMNVSTRASVQTGDNVTIGGFVISGSSPKKVLVTARGPSLAALGVPGTLANPVLQLFSGQTVVASNDDWGTNTNAAEIQATGFGPTNAQESALLVTLNPGPYTAIVTGTGGATGVGIVEVFEVDQPAVPLVNLSTRGLVLTGDNVMIGGFIVTGSGPRKVLVTARGPSLAALGVPGTLANPLLQLYSGQTVIASNDDWGSNANASEIQASGVAPTNPQESALLVTLNPGAYTAIVSGVGGATGIGIVEVFAQ